MLKGGLKGELWCLRRVGTQRRGIPGVVTDEEEVVVEEEGDLRHILWLEHSSRPLACLRMRKEKFHQSGNDSEGVSTLPQT